MRLVASVIFLLFVASATLSGCDDSKRAKTILEDAVNCKKPSADEVAIVYKEFKREGSKISESETKELLDLVCDVRMERDSTRSLKLQNRLRVIATKLQSGSKSIS